MAVEVDVERPPADVSEHQAVGPGHLSIGHVAEPRPGVAVIAEVLHVEVEVEVISVTRGAYELYQEGGDGSKGVDACDVSSACHWAVSVPELRFPSHPLQT